MTEHPGGIRALAADPRPPAEASLPAWSDQPTLIAPVTFGTMCREAVPPTRWFVGCVTGGGLSHRTVGQFGSRR